MISASRLTIEPKCVTAVIAAVGEHGRRGVETGVYLLACAEDPLHISVAAITGATGIQRSSRYLRVSAAANAEVYSWAAREGLTIVAYAHSHLAGAFLSRTDCEESLNVEGFISAVVPNFAHPPAHPGAWGWWRFLDGAWAAIDRPHVRTLAVGGRVVVFDEEGVRGYRDE